MSKKLIQVEIDYKFNWTYGVSIEQIRKDLDELEKLGVKEVEIEPYDSYGSSSVSIEAYINRIETDEEYSKRVERENNMKKQTEMKELELLKKLKEKYEK